jgi:N-acetylmuramoyl-L-alanine amidase
MDNDNSPIIPARQSKRSQGGFFSNLQYVIIVAAIAATLFTAWTEPGLLPNSLAENLEFALGSLSGTPVSSYPTTTPRPLLPVGIVAGHSGNDTGAICPEALGGYREVDINLDIANRVRTNLINEGYEVDLLTEFDPLLQGFQGLALVSIHADTCEYIGPDAKGFKIAAVASDYPERARRLTECLRTRYASVTELRFHAGSITTDMSSYHAFNEINPLTPAAIIEVGFMNLDRDLLTNQPDKVALGISNGLLCFLRNEDIQIVPTPTP